MKLQPYFPRTLPEQVIWLNDFGTSILAYVAALGLTSTQTDTIASGVSKFNLLSNFLKTIDTFKQSVTQFRNHFTKGAGTIGSMPVLVAPADPGGWFSGFFTFLFALVATIKKHPAYTEEMGKALGIIGAEPTFNPDTFQPTVSAAYHASTHSTSVKFEISETEGSNIYSRKAGDSVWTFLAYDMHSPYHDTRPLAVPGVPEKREYQAIPVLHSLQIGVPSKIIMEVFEG